MLIFIRAADDSKELAVLDTDKDGSFEHLGEQQIIDMLGTLDTLLEDAGANVQINWDAS